jgi:hypothetical protein
MQEPDDKPLFRERLRATKTFTPAGLLMAEEQIRRLPIPHDAVVPGSPDAASPGMNRHTIIIPRGLAYRLGEYASMRGISFNRLCTQLLAFYVCTLTDAEMNAIPAFVYDMLAPKSVEVLAQAFALAQDKLGMTPLERPVMKLSDAEFGSDISQEEKDRLANW